MNVAPEPLPPGPTVALPGTPEKLDILARRAANGESLWHPDDADITGRAAEPQLQRICGAQDPLLRLERQRRRAARRAG